MLEGELKRPQQHRIDAVVIVTPNATHFEIAKAFVQAGFNVICDKPLCTTSGQADELVALSREHGIVFAVTYNYSGYPMIKQARHLVRSGQLGTIRKVIAEYHQDWLGTAPRTRRAKASRLAHRSRACGRRRRDRRHRHARRAPRGLCQRARNRCTVRRSVKLRARPCAR
jgi:predicted dehydrogenase